MVEKEDRKELGPSDGIRLGGEDDEGVSRNKVVCLVAVLAAVSGRIASVIVRGASHGPSSSPILNRCCDGLDIGR